MINGTEDCVGPEEINLAERALLASIVEYSDDAIIGKKLDGTILSWNAAAEKMYGYSAQEAIGRSILIVVPPDRQDEMPRILEKVKKGETVDHYETKRMSHTGRQFHVSVSVSPIKNPSGEIVGACTIARDISDRKRAEEASQRAKEYSQGLLQASAERALLASIVEYSDDAIIGKTLNGTILSWNAAAEKMYGFSAEQAIGQSILVVVPPDRQDEIPKILERIKRGETVEHYETKRMDKYGDEIYVSVTVSPIKNASGEIVGASTVARDISDRKRAEEALQRASAYSRSLIEASLDPLVTISAEGKITDVNTATERVTGYSRNELIGTDFADYFTDPSRAREGYQQAFRDGSVRDYELEIRHRSGSLTQVTYNASVYSDDSGTIIGLFAAARDISDRKRAEKALQTASAYNRSLIEASLDPLVTISGEGKITDVNTGTERVTGYSRNELIGTDFADYFTDPEKARAGYQQAFKDGSVRDYELEIRHKNGELTPVMYNASVYRDESGTIIGLFAAARDITESKRAEKALQAASAYNRSLIEASLDPLVTISAEGKITDVNTGTERVTGYSRNELIGTDFADYFTDPSRARAGYQQVFRDGLVKDYELEIRHKNGELTPVMYNASVYRDESGRITGVFAAARDISDRKRAEEALKTASAYNRSLIEASLDPLVTISAEGKITDVNTGTERVTGFSRNELIGKDFADYFTDPENARAGYQQAFRDGSVRDYELEIRHKNGDLTQVTYNASVYSDESGKIIGLFAAARDISDRKRAEKALQTASAYNRSLIEASLDPLVTISAEGKINDVNTATERVTGYSRNELIGTDFADYFTDPAKARAGYQQAFKDGSVRDYELEIRHKNGDLTQVTYNASVYSDESGKIIGLFAAARDISDRKRAEKALQTASAYNRSLVEASLDPLVTISAEGKITDVNTGTERVTGFSRNELIGTDFADYFTDPSRARAGYQQVFRDGLVKDYELEIRHKNGMLTPVMYNASVYRDESGDIVGVFAAARDISDRKRAEEALQTASAYNRSLIEASLDPLVTISAEGKINDVNTATERVTGYSRNELVGTDFADYFTSPENARAGYQQAFRDGSVRDYELEIRHKSGNLTQVTYNASVYSDESGKIIGLFAAARDISARKKAEEALAKRNRDIEAILNASADSVFLLSADWSIVALNEATALRFGWKSNEVLGESLSSILPPDIEAKSRAKFNEVLQTGYAVRFEDEKDGRFYYTSFYPVLDANGNVGGVAGFDRDITEAKQAEIERERLITELEAKNAELERFTYSVSHDLRSPLITIRTFLGFVAENVTNGNTENLKSDLDRIDKAAEKMGQLLGEILELSRVGRLFNPPTKVPMRELVDETLELLSGRIAQHGVEVQVAPDLPILLVDRPRLLEVFQNLIENSMKFMGDQPHPRIEIGIKENGDETLLFVRDNGIGINPLYHEKVFGLFNKLDQKTEGTGIGLALAKRIVEVHGGRIWVESEGIGSGSTFYLTLPCPAPDDEK
ncbi:PAS domain S-box protein [Desulfomonile tiedjei]|uniref:histidine kinase n=1 Tax=Desulfomonile tiedjei (strain ATCC 49306 / DSM 6799 / DCB-1) TaxID=706587 RepID=I4CDR2_DESTA|nr:PAS domain S-box protein [Desulfomonile tiedjei]AFM27703.1 PAS domain S-box [Desulfomonile tiedjei DSM 6799]